MNGNKVTWRSPSNIAIVKYWGKKNVQQPINPSLSFSLSNSYTETEISYSAKISTDKISAKFFFDGQHQPDFEKRILKYFDTIYDQLAVFKKYHLKINSKNTFPHSAGIASSAAAMSSLALALLSIEKDTNETTFRKASSLARLGSGSACRSVYGKFTIWGKLNEVENSSDDFAIPFPYKLHPIFENLQDSILIIRSGKKSVSSSAGHNLMNNHPFKETRIKQATKHCIELLEVLQNDDFARFAEICENEALTLHGLMMNSSPSFILIEPETLSVIQKIREFRAQTKQNVCFTLDAGPNIHLIYPRENKEIIRQFIEEELLVYCENKQWIDDEMGSGPRKIV